MKTITVVCWGSTTLKVFREQLGELLAHKVAIHGYSCDDYIPEILDGDVVLVTSQTTMDRVRPHIADMSKVVRARRTVNYHEVVKLFSIPAGEDVLLVNDLPSSTNDVISVLQTLGVDHINYHPYYPGCGEYTRLPLAVTPGEGRLVPDCVQQIVDIKTRVIDITTLVAILTRLDLMESYGDSLSACYVRDMIALLRDNTQIMQKGARLQSQLQAIINTVSEGIVGTDEHGRISVFNPVAETVLGIPAASALNRKMETVKELAFLRGNAQHNGVETFSRVGGRHIITNVSGVEYANGEQGKVYSLKDISEIRRIEESARRTIRDEAGKARYTFSHFAGIGDVARDCLETAKLMARSEAAILLEGESGTGKELIAHSIHNASSRRNGPFIAVNFSAITESLLESELFGYEPGAFTGAMKGGGTGLFEAAHKGTIFLDEIGDAPLPFQLRLLRVLQEREIKRVGSVRTIPVDFRVIAATNKNLKDLVAQGLFRNDLYYRLNVLPLRLPSLRERRDDIPFLAGQVYRTLTGKDAGDFFDSILPHMTAYDWPGNFRELQNVVEYLVHICPGRRPTAALLSEDMCTAPRAHGEDDVTLVRNAILRGWEDRKRLGRRSIAERTGLPESRVRDALARLAAEGAIHIGKGRQGITPAEHAG